MAAKLTIICFCVGLFSFGQIPVDNLEAYYPFNGSALDESTNSNNGIVNGAILTTDRFGSVDSAYFFDGIDDYIDLTNDFDFPERSVNLWARPQSINPLLGSIYDSDHATLTNSHTKMFVIENTGNDEVTIGAGTASYFQDVSVDTWYMFTITRNTTETRFYVNGVLASTVVTGISNSGTGHDKALLGCTRLFDRFFQGKIDDVRIYSDVLTDCEVYSMYLENVSGLNTTQSDTL